MPDSTAAITTSITFVSASATAPALGSTGWAPPPKAPSTTALRIRTPTDSNEPFRAPFVHEMWTPPVHSIVEPEAVAAARKVFLK